MPDKEGKEIPTPKIKELEPGDMVWPTNRGPMLTPREMMAIPSPSKSVHDKEETDDSGSYARGGPALARSGSPHLKRRRR